MGWNSFNIGAFPAYLEKYANPNLCLDQQAIESLLTLAENYTGHGREMSQQGTKTMKGASSDTGLTMVETNLRVRV